MTSLPVPPLGRPDVVDWVARHFKGLYAGGPAASPSFVGGQSAAAAALASFDVAGYASRRNEVWPAVRRGASRLSPYIRHGLLSLPRVWEAVDGGPPRDVAKYRDELLWQEYARHLYARLGSSTRSGLRFASDPAGSDAPWPAAMVCVQTAVDELEQHGWLVNQARMWLASQWTVRSGADWRDGEDRFFFHLLDGSRAANRLGWQWTAGGGTGRAYGFSRRQVERRAPGLCSSCELRDNCPIEEWPPEPVLAPVESHPLLRRDPNPQDTAGPIAPVRRAEPASVWLTAESLGDEDPALTANPDLPAVFVFDGPLLDRLQLTSKRLVFLAETLADLSTRRSLEVGLGDPAEVLAGRKLAVTFAPVPGWRRLEFRLGAAEVHPWSWLRRPHGGSVASFSAWRKGFQVGK